MDKQMDGWVNKQTDDGWMDKWMMDGWMGKWMNRWINR